MCKIMFSYYIAYIAYNAYNMKPSPLHSLLFFLPDELSDTTVYNIIIFILCILLAFSLVALYRRIKYGSPLSYLEGMTTPETSDSNANTLALDPDLVDIKTQTDFLKTTYDNLNTGITDQKNRINANSQTLMKIMSDTPNQTNNLTHANLNTDDPSKTKIPNIDMS